MTRLIFLHNPKAGGTAVDRLLRQSFSPNQTALLISSPWTSEILDNEGLESKTYVSGHFGYTTAQAIDANAEIVTNFRDPISRIVSLYDYWKIQFEEEYITSNSDSGPALIKDMTFSEFVRTNHPKLSLYIHNFHSRQLLSDGWNSTRISYLERLQLRRRIARMKWFYVCEHPSLSQACLPPALQESSTLNSLVNATPYVIRPKTIPSPSDVRILIDRNKDDISIYSYAVALLLKRSRTPEAVMD